MSLTVKDTGGGDFELAPQGTHIARCYKIVDVGTQHNERWGTTKAQVIIFWELPQELRSEDNEPFIVSKKYTASLSEKANLRKDLEAWRNKTFTPEELEGFHLKNILGAYCMLQVVHNEGNNGKTYANVQSIMALPKGTEKPDGHNETFMFDMEEFDQDKFNNLSEGLQNLIRQSQELSGQAEPKTATEDGKAEFDQDFEDDIPF